MKTLATLLSLLTFTGISQAGTRTLYDANPDKNLQTPSPDPVKDYGWVVEKARGGKLPPVWGKSGTTKKGKAAWVLNDEGPTIATAENQCNMLCFDLPRDEVKALQQHGFTLTIKVNQRSSGGYVGFGCVPGAESLFGRTEPSRFGRVPNAGTETFKFTWDPKTEKLTKNTPVTNLNSQHWTGEESHSMRIFIADDSSMRSTMHLAIMKVEISSPAFEPPAIETAVSIGGIGLNLTKAKE